MPIITGGGAFNGGTFTQELTLAPTGPGFTQALAVQMPAGSSAAGSVVMEAKDENGNQIIFVDDLGDMDFHLIHASASIDFEDNGFNTLIGMSNSSVQVKAPPGGTLDITNENLVGIGFNATGMGFFSTAPVAKPTGVPVSAAGIHAALVALGLIAP